MRSRRICNPKLKAELAKTPTLLSYRRHDLSALVPKQALQPEALCRLHLVSLCNVHALRNERGLAPRLHEFRG